MALTTGTALALALAASSAGANYYNTQRTASRTDNALATQIRNQSAKQAEADAAVQAEVAKLEGSRSEEARAKALDSYADTLRRNRSKRDNAPAIGSATFQTDAADAAQALRAFGDERAGLMARIDAPTDQRREEAFGYGRLGTDLDLIAREARGQNWMDDLRVKRASRRNPGLDALSSLLQGAAGAAGSMGTGAGQASPFGPYASGYRYPGGSVTPLFKLPTYGSR